ncbi:MAG: hypothetical protein Q8O38_01675 [Sulfurimicrobium sp.]|nr:hypothetical protein [Sulfurimicrobium sp.]
MCQNIEDFNRGCALILAKLYSNFPEPVFIHIDQLDREADTLGEAQDVRARRLRIYGATMAFLSDEGYIRHSGSASVKDAFANVILTSKGLAALNKSPAKLDQSHKSAGDILLEVSMDFLKEGAREVAKTAVSSLWGMA